MYLRENRRKNRDGSAVTYVSLAHNERHPNTGVPRAKVIHNFGRADQLDEAALRRLVTSISRYLDPADAVAAAAGTEVDILESRRLGGAWTLNQLWERLGIGAAIRRVAEHRRLDGPAVERVLFALVAQRALEPDSKLEATRWVAERVVIDGCAGFSDDQAYRAMDFLLEALSEVAGEVFSSVAHLLNLDVSIVFVDTTTTHWHIEAADEADDPDAEATAAEEDATETAETGGAGAEEAPAGQASDESDEETNPIEAGTRAYGHNKDHRDDLPQVVIALAVTRDGIPVRCWTFPGDENDQRIIRTVKDDLDGWDLRRLVWVADRGFASQANRAYLARGGGHYIHAEKLRHTNREARAALARAGRYHTVAGNLEVKEAHVAPGGAGDGNGGARAQRFVICHNPEAADRDSAVRDRLVEHLQGLIAGSDAWSPARRDEFVGSLKPKPGLRRYLRRTSTGLLRIDRGAIKTEAHLDGKWLLRSDDDTLTSEDLAEAYKQLAAVERGWKDMKGALGLHPVFHHREDRIRSHVQLCWLALLLTRTAETATGQTWRALRHELDLLALVTLATPDGQVAQRSELTPDYKTILAALKLPEPPRFFEFTPTGQS